MTCKESHAKGAELLDHAAQLIEDAVRLMAKAKTVDGVETDNGPYRLTAKSLVGKMESLVKAADLVTCDDCGLLIAACDCSWSKAEVK